MTKNKAALTEMVFEKKQKFAIQADYDDECDISDSSMSNIDEEEVDLMKKVDNTDDLVDLRDQVVSQVYNDYAGQVHSSSTRPTQRAVVGKRNLNETVGRAIR